MERVIVTGANGFIGRNLVHELLRRNMEVICIDVSLSDELMNNANIDFISCVETSMNEMYEHLNGQHYDAFFHFGWAGTSGSTRGDYCLQLDNVKQTCDYIVLSKKLECKRFIFASSINEMQTYEYLQMNDISPSSGYIYGAAKLTGHLIGETVAYQNGIEFIPVIISNIYGAGEKSARLINTTVRKLLNHEHCSFTDGHQMYDFIYVTDAVNAITEIAEKGKAYHRYYIGSGNIRPLADYLIELKDIVDSHEVLGLGELPFNETELDYSQFELMKVQEDTGYINKISFHEGITLIINDIKEGMKNEEI